MTSEPLATATLAAGCFWCTEAIFARLKGVHSVISGYAGGDVKSPSYEQVSMGKTGHAEAIQITFDPTVISFKKILEVFWKTHNPTTPNQQGADVGPQYRSVIFYHNEVQKKTALAAKEEAQSMFDKPIITEIVPYTAFYPAEDYHQDFYSKSPAHPYCQVVIDPKIEKLTKEFGADLATE